MKQTTKACQLAASSADETDAVNQTADKAGSAQEAADAALADLALLGPRLAPDLAAAGAELGQLASSASAKVVGPAGYFIEGGQAAYNTYQGNWSEAAFEVADISIGVTLTVVAGPLGTAVAAAWGGIGGSKAATRVAAAAACAAGF